MPFCFCSSLQVGDVATAAGVGAGEVSVYDEAGDRVSSTSPLAAFINGPWRIVVGAAEAKFPGAPGEGEKELCVWSVCVCKWCCGLL